EDEKELAARQAALREEVLPELRGGTEGIAKWNSRSIENRSEAGCALKGCDLSGINMSGVDFWTEGRGPIDLQGCNFTDANLTGAIMHDASLRKAIFRRAKMDMIGLVGAKAPSADFSNASLTNANLLSASFTGATFENANLQECHLNLSQISK